MKKLYGWILKRSPRAIRSCGVFARFVQVLVVVLLISVVLPPGSAVAANASGTILVGTIPRSDRSLLTYHFAAPPTKNFPLLLYLDGSSGNSVTFVIPYFQPFVSLGFGVLTLEKKGVEPGDTGIPCRKGYLRTNDRQQRVEDGKLLLAAAPRLFPGWDGRLVVLGASEGGTIAPEIALSYPRTVAVVSLAGGGLSQSEELRILKKKELSAAGATKEKIAEALSQLDTQFAEIKGAPVSTQSWLGEDNTYKRWASYLWYSPLEFLAKLQMPLYVAHGTRDTAAPIESADAIQGQFQTLGKTNLTFRRYDDLDHNWKDSLGKNQISLVIGDLLKWLKQTLSL